MEFPIDKEEVIRHLEDLGYKNLSDEKVAQFIQDLTRLVKYEEKKTKRKLKAESHNLRGGASGYHQDQSSVSYSRSASVLSSSEGTAMIFSERTSSSVTSSRQSSSGDDSKISMKRSRDVRVLINIQEDRKEKDEPDSIKHLNDDTTRLRQILPPRLKHPTKPTVGFIRPRDQNSKLAKKSDPVRLYQYYKKVWEENRFPGDGSDKNLRWSVREWMMGEKQS